MILWQVRTNQVCLLPSQGSDSPPALFTETCPSLTAPEGEHVTWYSQPASSQTSKKTLEVFPEMSAFDIPCFISPP